MNGPANIPDLPNSIDAEQALLGALLTNNDVFYRLQGLEPTHFFEPLHQKIYEIASTLIRAGKGVSPVALKPFVPDVSVGDVSLSVYLARLSSLATSILNAPDYANTIRDLADRRALINLSHDLAEAAYASPLDQPTRELILTAEDRLIQLTSIEGDRHGFRPFDDLMVESIAMTAAAYQRDGKLSGLSTGLRDLDSKMGGLQASDLIIIAGRPGMGKSALAVNVGVNAASDGKRVGMFSLEMSGEQNATRVLSDRSQIPSSAMRRGGITESDFTKIGDAAKLLHALPFHIDDTGGLAINQLVSRARRLKKLKGMDLLIIDYIQLMQGASKGMNRVNDTTEITQKLKALAKELQVPIIALSQLSREVEKRDDKRPQLSDLRDSGSIEQDADVVMFLYREEYYLANKEPEQNTDEHAKWQAAIAAVHGKAEIIVGKQRHGPTGSVDVAFEAKFTRFSNIAQDRHLPERFS